MDAVVSTKYGKRPVLDVPPLNAYGGRSLKFNNSISSMMDYNTSSLIKQPQQPPIQYVPQQQPNTYVSQPQQVTQYVPQTQPQYVSQPQTTQYAPQPPPQTVPQPSTQYPTVPQQPTYPQPSGYNPYASAYTDPRAAATAPQYPPPDPNSFMAAMMNQFNPFNPTNMLAAPLVPPPVPGSFPPPPPNYPPPPPNYPPPEFNRTSYSQPTYGAAPPAMAQPVRSSPDDNFSIAGKLEFGKMTTVHVDSITGNFKQLPEILRRELKRTYGRYPETDIKISVENGEYHIYASPHRDDDRPIRGPRSYEEDDRRHFDDRHPYDHDDYKRQPRNSNDEFKPKRKDYDQDFVRGRGFEQEPRRRTEFDEFRGRDSRMTDAEWVLVKRR
ncbi:hypothetical protein LOTGIDRAFT_159167 [Lottia gigantea]|uniref:Uncharacterized protein n=1 Tax=Lottia gigantea TaxID=225164 RepID=V4AMJ6_LOTGI|nr:hypothetical protein LOTGIDRAFT_159167 [Lottia gigantea]ESO98362.1 hypothetical protein LOTGIDRAFT_159167 [Lottia gigantea]